MRALATLALVATASTASAAPSSEATASTERTVAITTNLPIAWLDGISLAGSLYYGTSARGAVRFNVARSDTWGDIVGGLLGGESMGFKRTLDIGVGYVAYEEKRFHGWSLELGAFVRMRDRLRHLDSLGLGGTVGSETTTVAVRPLLGYTWSGRNSRLFMAIAIGASLGYMRGEETETMEYDPDRTSKISGLGYELEAYWRIGFKL